MRFFNRKGQSTLEYAVLIAGVVGAVLIFAPYLQRVAQGRFKESTDRIADRFGGGTEQSITEAETAWEETSAGVTITNEQYSPSTGNIVTDTTEGETISRDEGVRWGTTTPDFRDF